MKIKFLISEIHSASVLILKVYSKDGQSHIKLGMSFFHKHDKRLIKFNEIPSDNEMSAVIEKISNNYVRGKLLEEKIKSVPSIEETELILYYIKNFCKDLFINDFVF